MEILMSSVFVSIRDLLEGVLEFKEFKEFKDHLFWSRFIQFIWEVMNKMSRGRVEELMQQEVKFGSQNIHDYAADNLKV